MSATTIYGLANCDTCRKAKKWLDRKGIAYRFVDYRDERPTPEMLRAWAKAAGGWTALVNRSGTTWRQLPDARKDPQFDPEWTLLIREHPTLVRRPVTVHGERIAIGFTDKLYAEMFSGEIEKGPRA
ncbi:MAG TPA: Spx/MgsR family RNA polymerase-binding regulatory protein [Xanthomonadales bacterium]|nr:Spx/MgsR family RNA polymerase-binding regulatory protein [Xanthomonadales bacterium]